MDKQKTPAGFATNEPKQVAGYAGAGKTRRDTRTTKPGQLLTRSLLQIFTWEKKKKVKQ